MLFSESLILEQTRAVCQGQTVWAVVIKLFKRIFEIGYYLPQTKAKSSSLSYFKSTISLKLINRVISGFVSFVSGSSYIIYKVNRFTNSGRVEPFFSKK